MPWSPSPNPAVRERWRAHLDALAASGLTVRDFARQHGIGAESLYRWRTWFRRQRRARRDLPALVEVHVIDDEAPAPVTTMVVELPSRRRLILEPGFDAAAVARLVTVLERA